VQGFIDELARMKQTQSAQGADEVYRTVEASLRTIRSRVKMFGSVPWFGSMISVTSPISRDDKAMRLLRQAPKISDMFARHYPTWKFNPFEPRKNFNSAFAKDPIGAARDFGAQPAGAEYPLIHDEERWYRTSVAEDRLALADFEYRQWEDALGHSYVSVLVKRITPGNDLRPRFVAFDAGQSFDAFAGACGHREYAMDQDGNEYPVTVYDWVFRIVPPPGVEVYFGSVVQLIKVLRPRTRFQFVAFDRWNSVQLIQDIRRLGIPAEQQSLKDRDCDDFKVNCFEGRVQMLPVVPAEFTTSETGELMFPLEYIVEPPFLHAQSASIYELLGLQRDPDTGKVYNPDKGKERGYSSDDTARVVIHVNRLVQRADYSERYDDRSRRSRQKRAEHGGQQWIAKSGGSVVHPRPGITGGPRVGGPRRW
jgi:hypothetical protein